MKNEEYHCENEFKIEFSDIIKRAKKNKLLNGAKKMLKYLLQNVKNMRCFRVIPS